MLPKKLAMVKDYVIVHCATSQFGGGGTHRQGRYGYWMLIFGERFSQCLCCGKL